MENVKWPKTGQYRDIVKQVRNHHDYKGTDEYGEAIYEHTSPYPKIQFRGTVKLHGINVGITYDVDSESICVQTRNQVLSLRSGPNAHNGFVGWVNENIDYFERYFTELTLGFVFQYLPKTITLFGEWAGRGIQKKVGICNAQSAFYLFGCRVDDFYQDIQGINTKPEIGFHNLLDFSIYWTEVDFNEPEKSSSTLEGLIKQVEKSCPVTKAVTDEQGIGEGIVWESFYAGAEYPLRFKVKGEYSMYINAVDM